MSITCGDYICAGGMPTLPFAWACSTPRPQHAQANSRPPTMGGQALGMPPGLRSIETAARAEADA